MKFAGRSQRRAVDNVARALYSICSVGTRSRRALKAMALVGQFGSHGSNFVFDPDGVYSFESIHVGDNVDLGYRPILLATKSVIRIGDDVMFGPEVTIRGGNHRFDVIGLRMRAVTEEMKRPEDDLGVVIEDDVWIGTRAVILHGVTIGRGSVVGAGSVVTKSVPEFTIVAGSPARVIRRRFTPEQLTEHLRLCDETPDGGLEVSN